MATPSLRRDNDTFIIDFGDDENVTSDEWVVEVNRLLDQVEAAEGPRALVTTGSAKHYSNGLDTGFMASIGGREVGEYVARVFKLVYRIMLLPVPTVAAVNGHAFGAGAFLVLAHDHAVMREDRGYFCFPEVHLQMPLPPMLMSVARASLSPKTLRQAVVTGHRYSGPESAAAGIVDATATLDTLIAVACSMVEPHAATASPNLGVLKRDLFPEIVSFLDADVV